LLPGQSAVVCQLRWQLTLLLLVVPVVQ